MSKRPEGRSIVEESPVGSKGSNGDVERMVQEMEDQIRSLWLGLQSRLGKSFKFEGENSRIYSRICSLSFQQVAPRL